MPPTPPIPLERQDQAGQPLPVHQCPTCHYTLNAATCIDVADKQARPARGDLSLCLKCGELLAYNEDLTVSAANINDLLDIPPSMSESLTKAQQAIRRHRPLDNPPPKKVGRWL